MLAP
jgi:peroxiredoxin